MNNDQLDFAFLADLPTVATQTSKRTPRGKVAVVTAPPASLPIAGLNVSAIDDPESIARALEAHPDYRVIRRLVPRLQWPMATGDQVCTVLILDTETTGLDASKEKVIELALLRVQVDLQTGLPSGSVQVYDGLEDPGIPIPKEVQKITGIDDAMVAGQRLDEQRIAELMQGVDLVIAHNAGFDRPFVESRLPQFSHLAWACSFADINWKDQGRTSSKLESLAQALGLFYDAHRAEMDCHALLAVLTASIKRSHQPDGGETGAGSATDSGLVCLIGKARSFSYRLQATNAPFDSKDKLKARGYRWLGDQKVWQSRIENSADLQVELDWLREHVYHRRSAVVQVEKLDAKVRYSNRPGEIQLHPL